VYGRGDWVIVVVVYCAREVFLGIAGEVLDPIVAR
jgi:hypothetical protein